MPKAVSIDKTLLKQIHRVLHEAKRPDLALRLMKEVALIRAEHVENLLCPVHAAKLRGGSRRKIYDHAYRGNLSVYKICCRSFVSRQQLKDLPYYGHRKSEVRG